MPEQAEVCLHTPAPAGAEHEGAVQHWISLDPGHRPAVKVPPAQHPLDLDTQTPSRPPTEQMAEYGQEEEEEEVRRP